MFDIIGKKSLPKNDLRCSKAILKYITGIIKNKKKYNKLKSKLIQNVIDMHNINKDKYINEIKLIRNKISNVTKIDFKDIYRLINKYEQ